MHKQLASNTFVIKKNARVLKENAISSHDSSDFAL